MINILFVLTSSRICLSQVAAFFDATIATGADIKLAANWIMGDIAAYMNNEKLSINDIKLAPEELGELIASIKGGTISGKIGKEVPTFSCPSPPYIDVFKVLAISDSNSPSKSFFLMLLL